MQDRYPVQGRFETPEDFENRCIAWYKRQERAADAADHFRDVSKDRRSEGTDD